jgi:hypothetical protein
MPDWTNVPGGRVGGIVMPMRKEMARQHFVSR